ncbi:MAG TPA: ATPase [Syntrophomonadaceae bacterium]|nr:ATPase [Syntrophomonadaceae bacterium]
MSTLAYFGVEGLDRIISQGMVYGSQIMVHGDTGIGKTVLAGEFIKEGLRCGDVCIYVACDEPPDVMRRHLGGFKVGTRAYEEAGRLVFVDAYEEEASPEKYHIADQHNLDKYFALERELVKRFEGRRIRLVVDSLSTLFTPLDSTEVMEFHRTRLKYLRKHGILALDVFVDGVLDGRVMTVASHLYNVIVRMKFGASENRPVRILQVGKVRSGKFSAAPYMFGISPVFGIILAPESEV